MIVMADSFDTIIDDFQAIYKMNQKAVDNYYSKPQREEFFVDSGYYKYHEATHLLKFQNERQMLEKAYKTYVELRKAGLWVPNHSEV